MLTTWREGGPASFCLKTLQDPSGDSLTAKNLVDGLQGAASHPVTPSGTPPLHTHTHPPLTLFFHASNALSRPLLEAVHYWKRLHRTSSPKMSKERS